MHPLQLRQEGTFCITKASPAQGAGLVVASSFSLDGAMTPLLAAFTPSAGKPVPGGGKREKRKEYSCAWNSPSACRGGASPPFLSFSLRTHAQGGLKQTGYPLPVFERVNRWQIKHQIIGVIAKLCRCNHSCLIWIWCGRSLKWRSCSNLLGIQRKHLSLLPLL